jgi:hypothetical protein
MGILQSEEPYILSLRPFLFHFVCSLRLAIIPEFQPLRAICLCIQKPAD